MKRMRNRWHNLTGLFLLGAAAAPAAAQGSIQMTADPVFAGMSGRGITPVVVTLQNMGPSVDGAVTVDSSGMGMGNTRTYVYPVNLPTGSTKKIITYPRVDNYSSALHVAFNGSFAGKKPSLDVPVYSGGAFNIALIGDHVGGLGALRQLSPQPNTDIPASGAVSYRDSYARPEDAPDRAAGYATLTAVVLSNGAERLNPRQWEAIRRWTMAGGTLVCTGGAGAVYLQTPGAAALLPVRGVRGGSVPSLSLPRLGASLPAGPYALMTGAPVAGAAVRARSAGLVTMATRRLGAGTVVFLAFSPFEAPLRGWNGSAPFWTMTLDTGSPLMSWQGLRQLPEMTDPTSPAALGYPGPPPMPGGPPVPAVPPMPGGPVADAVNPFHIELPPIGLVAAIFALYFILAVPVTYLVLKKAKRLEWAWITNPMLAGVFAFVFYMFTAQLYKAGMSRRTSGVLVAAAGAPDALLLGSTQMFFPRGGNHPVIVPDAESLEVSSPSPNGYPGAREQDDSLTTVDTGMVAAPSFPVTNLAFRSIYYVQPVTFPGGVSARLTRGPDGQVSGTVHNGTGQDLKNVIVIVSGKERYARVGDVKAGATARVHAVKAARTARQVQEPVRKRPGQRNPPMRTVTRWEVAPELSISPAMFRIVEALASDPAASGSAMLSARVSGDAYGPMMGRYVPGGSVSLLVSLPVEGGA